MVSPKTQKIFVIVIVLLLLGFFGYNAIMTDTVVVQDAGILSDTEVAGQDILALVERLKATSIDQSFFSSPLFSGLRDYSQAIFPEVRGRVNPFAAIGSDGSLNIQTQTQATSTGAGTKAR